MAAAIGAGQRESFALGSTDSGQASPGWANVRPLGGAGKGAVGGWIELLARISHDLRTPLNAVIGFSDAMQQELFGPLGNARYQEYASHIRASGVELLGAAEDALAMTALLAQPKSVTVCDVALATLVCGAADDLAAHAMAKAASIDVDIPYDLEVRSDPRQLSRAVRQMIAVGLSRASAGAQINVKASAEKGLVELIVEVERAHGDAPPVTVRGSSARLELGLGRLDLAVWLAVALLDTLDTTLTLDLEGNALTLRTTLEQAIQHDFFADAPTCGR